MRGFHPHVSVPPLTYRRCLLQKYVRITFIRKNSVAYVKKITLSVSVSSPLPFIRSYRTEFYFSVSAVRTGLQLRPLFCAGNSAPFSRALHPAFWACRAITAHRPQQQRLVRTRFLRKRYGNNTATATALQLYGNGYGMLEIRH